MADPLSLTLSVAGLITFTELIVSRGYEFIKVAKQVKHAKSEITELLAEITALYGVLHSLHLAALRFEADQFKTTIQLDYLQSCRQLVDRIWSKLKAALPTDSGARFKNATKSLRWPFSSEETKSLIKDIERHKAALSLALNADGLNALVSILSQQQTLNKGHDDVRNSMIQLQENLDAQRTRDEIAASRTRRQEQLTEWTTLDPETQHAAADRLRHRGTGKWFLDGEDFALYMNGHTPCIWLYGFAGAGKTVLTSAIIETVKSKVSGNPGEGLAYFYCDYKNTATQTAESILRSLIKHAALQNERSCEDLQKHLDAYKPRGSLSSTASVSQLRDLLVEMTRHYDCFYIIVDALDECTSDAHRHEVLSVLKDLEADAANTRLAYTSREEIEIKEALTRFKSVRITANKKDLEMYAASEIYERSSSGRLNITHLEVKEKIIETLSHGADGMFRWVACQLDYLCELTNDRARLRALNELPPSLFETYERILERVMNHNEDVQKIVERTLRWTLGAVRPLELPELIEAIAIEEDEDSLDEYRKPSEVDILRWCSCLIRKTTNASSSSFHLYEMPGNQVEGIELAHFTVEEFFKAIDPEKKPRLRRFANLKSMANANLGRTCLTYLQYEEFNGVPINDQPWGSERPFGKYAALQWHHHSAEQWLDEPTKHLMQRLFHPSVTTQFVKWNRYRWLVLDNVRQSEITDDDVDQWKQTHFQLVDSVSPLHRAASLALADLTEWLVSKGSDPNKPSYLGSPLECTLSSGYEEGEVEAVRKVITVLLHVGANPNTMSEYHQETPLALAVKSEEIDLIKTMLDAGAVVDMSCLNMLQRRMSRKYASGEVLPAFLEAISYANLPISIKPALMDLALNYPSTTQKALNMLEQSSVHFPENGELLDLTLQDAAQKGQFDVVSKTVPFLINSIDARTGADERTALHYACMNGHHDIVSLLLNKKANANAQDKEGNTPGHLCIVHNLDVKVLEMLFENGASLSIKNTEQENLLHLAAQSAQPDVLAFLLTKDPTCEYRNMRTVEGKSLALCALASSLESLEMLTLAGNSISMSTCRSGNGKGETGLHLSTKIKDEERMKFFLEKGNLNEQSHDGSTALHLAVLEDDTDVIELLLDRGADVCLVTKNNETPLHLAALESPVHLDALTALLAAPGIETIINNKDTSGCAAIHYVVGGQHYTSRDVEALEKLLIIPNVDANMTDDENKTSLLRLAAGYKTIKHSEEEIQQLVKLLLDRDVNFDKADNSNSTALHYLCGGNITPLLASTIDLLLEKGTNVLARNIDGALAVEIMLSELELSDKQGQGLSDPEAQVLGSLLRRLSDEHFNSLNRGWTRPLVLALQLKATLLVEELALRTTDVHTSFAEDKWTFSPLEASCVYQCDFKIFETLASRCQSLSKRNAAGNTLLHLTCSHNRIDILRYLLARNVELEIEDASGSTPLHLSLRYGRTEMMEALLDAGAQPSHLQRGGMNLWHAAAFSPSTEILDRLFRRSKNIELEARNSIGYTPLLCAVASGQKESVEKLLARQANINAIDNGANGVLHWASNCGNVEILKLLIQRDSTLDVNASNTHGETPLLLAVSGGHYACAAALVDSGADPQVQDESDQTLLHHLALGGRWDIFSLLESRGIDLDLEGKGKWGKTPLLLAVEKGHALMVQQLIRKGANVHTAGADGYSPLHLAAYHGQANVIDTLVGREKCGIDVNARHPADGNTALGIAASQGHSAFVESLLWKDADPQRTNDKRQTVIHIAAANKKRTSLKAILEHCDLFEVKYDINARDYEGRTALMLVEAEGADKSATKFFAKLLKKHGAKTFDPLPDGSEARKAKAKWAGNGGLCNIDAF